MANKNLKSSLLHFYKKVYDQGVEDTKKSILEVIENHRGDDPREVIDVIILCCRSGV